MNQSTKARVLFVCMGNICRSPTADGVFTDIVKQKNLSNVIDVDSAGTHAYHIGNPPDKRSQVTAKSQGIDLSRLVARKVTLEDFDTFDYIIAMDKDNLANLHNLQRSLDEDKSQNDEDYSSRAFLHLFMEFTDNWPNDEVPDPYYGGDDGFKNVFKMVVDASKGLLTHIEESNFRK